MNNNNSYDNSSDLDNFLIYLDSPDLDDEGKKSLPAVESSTSKISKAGESLIAGRPLSTDEAKKYSKEEAKKLLLTYINNREWRETRQPQHKKIMEIYNRLKHTSNGEGRTWADEIPIELLETLNPDANKAQPDELILTDVEDLILKDLFLPDPPEEQLFHETPKLGDRVRSDVIVHNHEFKHVGGIPPQETKVLFHIHADEFGANSQLEGGHSKDMVDYLNHFFSKSNHPSANEELREELEHFISFRGYDPKTIRHKLEARLEKNSPFLLEGGWIGTPGHAIYYEIIPEKDATLTFRIFNTGEGMQHHDDQIQGHKQKYCAYLDWKGIDRSLILSDEFLTVLWELKTNLLTPVSEFPSLYKSTDIYDSLRSILKPRVELEGDSGDWDETKLMTPQYSGVCSWKSLMAFLRTKMSISDYKRFKADIKLQSLLDYTEGKTATSTEWRLVKKSYETLCRTIAKLYQNKQIGDLYVKGVSPELAKIKQWIQTNKSILSERPSCELPREYQAVLNGENDTIPLDPRYITDTIENLASETQIKIEKQEMSLLKFHDIQRNYPGELCDSIENLIRLAETAWEQTSDATLHKGIIDFIRNLSIDEKDWMDATQQQREVIEKLITQFSQISELFFLSCGTIENPQIPFSERAYVFTKITYLQQILCKQLAPPWNQMNVLKCPDQNNQLLFYTDPKMNQEMESFYKLEKALKELRRRYRFPDPEIGMGMDLHFDGREWIQFIQASSQSKEFTGLVLNFYDIRLNDHHPFYEVLQKEYPEVVANVKEIFQKSKGENFNRLTYKEQNAYIYASDHLPSWLTAIRNTRMRTEFALKSVSSNPRERPPRNQSKPIFNVERDNKNTKVTIKFNLFEAKEIKEDKSLSQFPTIKNKTIQDLLLNTADPTAFHEKIFILNRRENETTLQNRSGLGAKVNLKNLSKEELVEIGRLFAKNGVRLIEMIEFFTKYPQKLQIVDYQIIFEIGIFGTGELNQALGINGFRDTLKSFLKKNILNFSESNSIRPTIFLLRMSHLISKFLSDEQMQADVRETLGELMLRSGLTVEENVLIYAEMAAQLKDQKEINEQEVALLLTTSIYTIENKGELTVPLNPRTFKELREALLIHQDQILQTLRMGNPNHALLNQIASKLLPGKEQSHRWKEERIGNGPTQFVAEMETLRIDPITPGLILKEKESFMPYEIRDNPLFQELFPGIVKGVLLNVATNRYKFIDKRGYETVLEGYKSHIVINQNRHGIWYRYIPNSALLCKDVSSREVRSKIGNRWISEKYQLWLEVNDATELKIYAFDPISNKNRYVIEGIKDRKEPRLTEVKNLKDSTKLGRTSKLFTQFEDPSYIQEWFHSDGRLAKIELPRFGLNFTPNQYDPTQLDCHEFPGFYLNVKDPIPKLGDIHHYILLQNKEGRKKVLLPNQTFIPPRQFEVLDHAFRLDQQLKETITAEQDYYVYDLQKNGHFFSKSREANLYLAQTLAIAQEYNRAAYYLKQAGNKLSRLTPEEESILLNIGRIDTITGDKSGNGIVLQLYSLLLVYRNQQSHHMEIEENLRKLITAKYSNYLTHFGAITAFKLLPEEEIEILKFIIIPPLNPIFFLRLKELDPVQAQQCSYTLDEISPSLPQNSLNFGSLPYVTKWIERSFNLEPIQETDHFNSLTRPLVMLDFDFWRMYQFAKKGTPSQQNEIKMAIPFFKNMDQIERKWVGYFLEAVLLNPDKFPDPSLIQQGRHNPEALKFAQELALAADKYIVLDKTIRTKPERPPVRVSDLHEQQNKSAPFAPPLHVKSIPSLSEQLKAAFQPLPPPKKEVNPELIKVIQACKGEDPVQQNEVKRLEMDLAEFVKIPPAEAYTASEEAIDQIKQILENSKEKDKRLKTQLEAELIALANKIPDSSSLQEIFRVELGGKLKKIITVEDLIIHFARQNYNELQKRNPYLSDEQIGTIQNLIGEYLLIATRHQQAKRTLQSIAELDSCSPEDKQELIQQIADKGLSCRCFDPNERPAFLAFEYFADLLMRSSQKETLEKFLSGGDPNIVMEMIMGSGKSKVLLPLLGLLRADGDILSMLIVPEPLFESVSKDTQAILQALSQSLTSIHFNRQTSLTTKKLESILSTLQQTRENRNCLMMTSKSVQCLILKFIEEAQLHFTGSREPGPIPKELQLMQTILNVLKEKGYPIIDEADTVLNVLKEVSFSGGKNVAPESYEIDLLSELYSLILEDPQIKSIAKVESDPSPDLSAPVITEESYFGSMQSSLIDAIIGRLTILQFDTNELTNKIQTFAKELSPENRQQLVYFLKRDPEKKSSAQMYFNSLEPDIQNVIAFLGEQLSHLLPFTLTRVHEERYGLEPDSNNPIAIPYSAAQTPSLGSNFSNAHITMNYTFQTYLKKGFSQKMVQDQIAILQERAIFEVMESGGKLNIAETTAGKQFFEMRGKITIPLFNYNTSHLQSFTDHINQDLNLKRYFVSKVILPQLGLFQYKMSCNPHNLVSFFRKAAGFTGTLWNGVSMHYSLSPQPAVGTDAKTLNLLWTHSESNAETVSSEKLMVVLQETGSIPFSMIADAGGYFKEGSNLEMARTIALTKGKPVVFYNAKGEQTITDGNLEMPLSETHTKPKDRLTFLDQSHTTGSDVPQKMDAISLVTIGRNMLLRDLLQSVWRLRGLAQAQRVRFLISEEVSDVIRQKLKLNPGQNIQLPEILQFVIMNQATQQGKDNYKALKQEFQNILQKTLLTVLLHEKLTPEAKKQAFQVLQSSWIKPSVFQSRDIYGSLPVERPKVEPLTVDIRKAKNAIQKALEKLPWLSEIGINLETCNQELNQIIQKIEENLPSHLPDPNGEVDEDQTVEIEQELKIETERETQLEVEEHVSNAESNNLYLESEKLEEVDSFEKAIQILNTGNFTQSNCICIARTSSYPLFPLTSYMQTNAILKNYASAFLGIHISFSVLHTPIRYRANDIPQSELLGSNRTDIHHLLIEEDKVKILTQLEAASYKDDPNYYNLTLGFLDPNRTLTKTQLLQVAKVKFLNGVSNYTVEELDLLKAWLTRQGPKKMKDLFLQQILKGKPDKTARYQGSHLQALFLKLK